MSSNLIVNNIEVGAGATIYTAASNQLTFGTNGTEKLRITSTGAVGIGTNNPISGAAGARLAVHLDDNTSYAGGTARGNGIIVYNATAGGHSSLELAQRNSANTYGTVILNAVNPADGNNYGADFTIQTRATGSGNYGERLRIASDGDVIVGGTDAGYPNFADNLTIHDTQHSGITIRSGIASQGAIYFSDATGSGAGTYVGNIIYDHSDNHMRFATSGTERLRIKSDGKVGIGTDVPDYGLHVYGAGDILIEDSGNGSAHLRLRSANGGSDVSNWKLKTSSNNYFYIENDTVGGASQFTIDSSGDVDVRGNIKSNNLSGRNRITNGDMRVSQRYGTTETTINVNAWHYILDRFKMFQNTNGQATVTQVTSGYAASNTGSGNALRIKVTSADTSLSGTQQLQLTQVIEGFNWEDMRFGTSNAKSFTVSFSILATGASSGNVTGTYCVNAVNFGNYDRAYVKEYTIDAVDVWKRVTLTFPGCTDGTWGTGANGSLRLGWFFAGPTSQQGAANQWHTSYKGSTTNQKNGMGVVNNFWFIKDIQVEEGTVATPFERRSYVEELSRCQRYCFRLGGGDTEVGTTLAMAIQSHATQCKAHIQFPVPVRSKDLTYTISDLTLDDDVDSYAAGRVNSVSSDVSGTTSSSLFFNTDSLGNVRPTRVVADTVGGYIQGECEL